MLNIDMCWSYWFSSTFSQQIYTFIPNADSNKDSNMVVKPIWVVMMEKSQSMNES